MQASHRFTASSAVFDDEHLVLCAGLVTVMTLATQTGLPDLVAEKVRIAEPRIRCGPANRSPNLTRQLEPVLQEDLAALCRHVDLLPGGEGRSLVDIDSLLRPVYG